jgi:membrane protein required for colicin V production
LGEETAYTVNALDAGIVLLLIWGMVRGYRNGFVSMVFSVIALGAGIVAGMWSICVGYMDLQSHIPLPEYWRPLFTFLIVFAGIVLLVRLLGAALRQRVHASPFGMADKCIGAVLGVLRTLMWMMLFMALMESLELSTPSMAEDSVVYYYLTVGYEKVRSLL